MRCLALDIGGTKIAAAIVKNGVIEQRQQIHTPRENVVEGMHQALAKLLADYERQFDYVAVASTGIINNGILTALNPKNLGGLAEFPLKASIAKHTDKPIGLLNDAQAATYAEYQLQNPEQVSNFAFITVSTGVGGGIVLSICWLIQVVQCAVVVVEVASKQLLLGVQLRQLLRSGIIHASLKRFSSVLEKAIQNRPL